MQHARMLSVLYPRSRPRQQSNEDRSFFSSVLISDGEKTIDSASFAFVRWFHIRFHQLIDQRHDSTGRTMLRWSIDVHSHTNALRKVPRQSDDAFILCPSVVASISALYWNSEACSCSIGRMSDRDCPSAESWRRSSNELIDSSLSFRLSALVVVFVSFSPFDLNIFGRRARVCLISGLPRIYRTHKHARHAPLTMDDGWFSWSTTTADEKIPFGDKSKRIRCETSRTFLGHRSSSFSRFRL